MTIKKLLLASALSLLTILVQAQNEPKIETLKVDINTNGIVDTIKSIDNRLEMKIDNKNYSIPMEEIFGFQHLSELSFKNNILLISGYNDGTGLYTWTYKFRTNKLTKKIELIGYDDFNKWVSGNLKTSFNAITGQSEVTVVEYDEKKQSMVSTVHKDKPIIGKIILTEIKKQDIDKLSAIGMKYEPK